MQILTCPYITKVDKLPADVEAQLWMDIRQGCSERGYDLTIGEIYRVDNPSLKNKFKSKSRSNIRQLYHGTTTSGVLGICKYGFRLPSKYNPNMFGAGVYLAQVPQKSYEYTDFNGYVLICDVAIGRAKTIREPKWLDPREDLKKTYLFGLIEKRYDSAHAPAGISTVSDEHIIFDPHRICPKYIIATEIA